MHTSGQTPRTATTPISIRIRSVVGMSTDSNDAYVNTVAVYNYQLGSFRYIIGNNQGRYGSEIVYFIIIGI